MNLGVVRSSSASFIARHFAVSEVAVFGVADDKRGEAPIAAVIVKAGKTLKRVTRGCYTKGVGDYSGS